MNNSTVVINGNEHEDIIYDDPDNCIQVAEHEEAVKNEDITLKIVTAEVDDNGEKDAGDIDLSNEITAETAENEYGELDALIERLPENFPAAEEMIKNDIAPLLIDCNPGIKDHYIKIIKKRTKAASIKSVSILIDEVTKEINENNSDIDEIPSNNTVIEPEIIEAAEQIANDPMLFKNKIDLVN